MSDGVLYFRGSSAYKLGGVASKTRLGCFRILRGRVLLCEIAVRCEIRQTYLRFKCKQLLISPSAQTKSEMKQNASTQNPKTQFRDASVHPSAEREDLWDFTYDGGDYFAVLPFVFLFLIWNMKCTLCPVPHVHFEWMRENSSYSVWSERALRAELVVFVYLFYLISSICLLQMSLKFSQCIWSVGEGRGTWQGCLHKPIQGHFL